MLAMATTPMTAARVSTAGVPPDCRAATVRGPKIAVSMLNAPDAAASYTMPASSTAESKRAATHSAIVVSVKQLISAAAASATRTGR